jgi:hypothetical protein
VTGNWLGGVDSNTKNLIIVGASDFCWAPWLNRDKSPNKSYNEVLFSATH